MCDRNGYITPAVSGAHVWTEWLHHPCRLSGPCEVGMTMSPLLCRGPMCGRNVYLTPAVLAAHV